MRLIDADTLKDRLQSLAYDDWNQGVSTSWADAYREVADMVEEQPTIQPQRMRGRWIYNSTVTMKCDQCGIAIKDWDRHRFKICPGCGADMREEQDG